MKRPQLHPPHTRGIPVIAGRSHFTRKNTRFRAPASSPKQSPCNIHAAITLRFAASRSKPASLSTHMATPDDNNHAAIPFSLHPQIQETHRTTHAGTTTRCRTQRRNQFADETTAAAPAAHTRYTCHRRQKATLDGKTQGFVLRLPPQNKAHATFMQPLQCVSQHHVPNLHLSTHMATPDDSNRVAIPVRSATTDSRHA